MEDHGGTMSLDSAYDGLGVAQISCHEVHLIGHRRQVGIFTVTCRPLNPQHLDTTPNEILSKVRPILATNTRD